MPSRRLLLRTIVTALCATAAVAIVVLLSRSFDSLTGRILLTTTAISASALLVVPAGTLLDRDRHALLARSSAVLTLTAFVLSLILIWVDDRPLWLWKAWGVVGTLSLAAAQGCAVESRRRDSDTELVQRLVTGSAVSGGLLTGLGVLAILAEIDDGGYYRVLGALAIIDVLCVVLVAVFRRSTGPIDRTHRLRIDGRFVESPGRDFAAAVATAIREAERDGSEVRRIERA